MLETYEGEILPLRWFINYERLRRTLWRTDEASYRVASPQLKKTNFWFFFFLWQRISEKKLKLFKIQDHWKSHWKLSHLVSIPCIRHIYLFSFDNRISLKENFAYLISWCLWLQIFEWKSSVSPYFLHHFLDNDGARMLLKDKLSLKILGVFIFITF